MWSSEQRQRLAYEKGLLRRYNYVNDFSFINPTDDQNCELIGWIKSSFGNYYQVRFRITNYPYSCPEAYIVRPTMYDYYGRKLIDYETSHSMHLLKPRNNEVHMCLYHSDYWSPNKNLANLIVKARIWLEAYEQHLITGKDIDCFVNSY